MFDEISYEQAQERIEQAARVSETTLGSWEELYSTADQPLNAVPVMGCQDLYQCGESGDHGGSYPLVSGFNPRRRYQAS